jgi:C2 domain
VNASRIIHQYYRERYLMQQLIASSPFHPYGVLSIKVFFFGNILKLEILNAKNLIPFGGNRKCDSFVKINIIPEDAFPKHQNYKTRVETDTHFPLYDELFEL